MTWILITIQAENSNTMVWYLHMGKVEISVPDPNPHGFCSPAAVSGSRNTYGFRSGSRSNEIVNFQNKSDPKNAFAPYFKQVFLCKKSTFWGRKHDQNPDSHLFCSLDPDPHWGKMLYLVRIPTETNADPKHRVEMNHIYRFSTYLILVPFY